MQKRKTDMRVLKTEQSLINALSTLLQDRTFEQITISDLCDAAKIRRATFYKHFRDKYDFLEFCIQKRLDAFDDDYPKGMVKNSLDYYMAVLGDIIRYLKENRKLFEQTTSVRAVQSATLAFTFAKRLHISIEQRCRMRMENGEELIAPPEIVAGFFSGAVLSVTRWWFDTESSMSEADLLIHIRAMLAGSIPMVSKTKEG